MLEPKHSQLADKVFRIYLDRLFKKHFAAFHQLDETPQIKANYPLLLLPNHSSWWDGFFVYALNQLWFKRRLFLMMLDEQLRNFRFFRRLGAYGIEPKSHKSIREMITYSRSILNGEFGKNVLLCIFPQGELLPWSNKPINFKRGIDKILNNAEAHLSVLPLAMRIEMLAEQRPEVFFMAGKPEFTTGQKASGSEHWQIEMNTLAEKLVKNINQGEKGIQIFSGGISVNQQVTKISKKFSHH